MKSCNYGVQKAPPFSVLMLRRIEKGGVFYEKKDDFSHPCIDPVVILLRDSASYIRTSSYAVGFNHHQWNNSYMQSVYRQAWKNHPCNTSIMARPYDDRLLER